MTPVTIAFKNKEDMNRMSDFLNIHQDLINQLKNIDEDITNLCVLNKEHLNEKSSKYVLGYENGSNKFVWSLSAWIAKKAGIKDKNGDSYITYNTIKRHVRESSKDNINEIIVNKEGVQIFSEDPLVQSLKSLEGKGLNNLSYDVFDKVVHVLEQLNIHWNKYILEDSTHIASNLKKKI